ncbi:MAG: Acetylglutamate kinase [Alphaproteobacteria bacterium MarineAlpha10_Bin3]|jgi:acetylglutamate kinase|nr:MAG: Acetylglutamate kinase [Alphaproteobacteria bacterium MarineAlpha10_Bin3]PPR67882.1 MAG: Acetylglutamate kinase [Alphaproteobacteria bacterium MarineAlpha4_Bin1]
MSDNATEQREDWLAKADILTEALPYMRQHAGQAIIIKYGGHAMGDAALSDAFARDVVLLKQVGLHPIVVHGGGPQIGAMLERLEIKSEFIDGLRVTDAATVEIVEMVLSGRINKGIVAAITKAGGRAVGLSGKDGGLIRARKLERRKRDSDSNIERVLDLGFVGEPTHVDATVLDVFAGSELIPIIAPIGLGEDAETYNINADTVAGAIAIATGATRLLLLTDIEGVLDKNGVLIKEMSIGDARARMADGTLTGGMIPKVETCIAAIEGGVEAAVIVDGRTPHATLLEIFTAHGSGTMIRAA